MCQNLYLAFFSAPYVERERDERDECRPLKECPNRLDPLAKVVWHVPKPIPSLFSAPYVERERERDERDEHRPLKECPNRLDPLAWDLAEGPKGPQKEARRAPRRGPAGLPAHRRC